MRTEVATGFHYRVGMWLEPGTKFLLDHGATPLAPTFTFESERFCSNYALTGHSIEQQATNKTINHPNLEIKVRYESSRLAGKVPC